MTICSRSSTGRLEPSSQPTPGHAAFLAAPARQSIREGAVLWVALRPSRLEAVMKDPPRDMANLSLFARALRQATWAYLTLRIRPGRISPAIAASSFHGNSRRRPGDARRSQRLERVRGRDGRQEFKQRRRRPMGPSPTHRRIRPTRRNRPSLVANRSGAVAKPSVKGRVSKKGRVS